MQTENQTTPVLEKPPGQPDLAQVIAESTAKLEEQAAPKRGRGRPVGWRKNPGAEPKANEKPPGQGPAASRKVEGDLVKINEIEPLSAEICKAPFDFIGWKAGVDITPTDEETKAPARYLSKLIDAYIPDLESKDPKIFAWAAFGISYLLLAIKKFRVLFAQKKKASDETSTVVVENDKGEMVVKEQEPLNLPAETIHAGQFFRR
nr:hypothetical protein CKG001_17680 [Bdellovibrio sp. CKG001]